MASANATRWLLYIDKRGADSQGDYLPCCLLDIAPALIDEGIPISLPTLLNTQSHIRMCARINTRLRHLGYLASVAVSDIYVILLKQKLALKR